jgi:putative transposase
MIDVDPGNQQGVYLMLTHIVWVTKDRKNILTGRVATSVREEIKKICKSEEVEIKGGTISTDYVYMFISYPPKLNISKFVQKLKKETSHKLNPDNKNGEKPYADRLLWAKGFFCYTCGDVTDQMIRNYVNGKKQTELGKLCEID